MANDINVAADPFMRERIEVWGRLIWFPGCAQNTEVNRNQGNASIGWEFYLEYPSTWTAAQAARHYLELLGVTAEDWEMHVLGIVWGHPHHLTRYRFTGPPATVAAVQAAHRAHQQLTGRNIPKLND